LFTDKAKTMPTITALIIKLFFTKTLSLRPILVRKLVGLALFWCLRLVLVKLVSLAYFCKATANCNPLSL